MKQNSTYAPLVSMVLMVVGLGLFLFSNSEISVYIFLVGAVLLTLVRFIAMARAKGTAEVTRLPQIHFLSAAALVFSGYLMYDGSNSWSVLLLVSAAIEVYVSYRSK